MCGTQATIRDVNLFDLLVAGEMAEAYASEVKEMLNHTISHQKLMNGLALASADPDQYLRFLLVNDKVAGAMWGCLSSMPWSETIIAQDLLYYVRPEFRGYGMKLIRDWVSWASSKGAKECCLSIASGINVERTTKLFEKKGFNLIGYSFTQELQ